MNPVKDPDCQADPDGVKPKRPLLRVALGVFLWVELRALLEPDYDLRTRGLIKIVLLVTAVNMVSRGLGPLRDLTAWLRAGFAVLLLVVGEFALLMNFNPITWTPFALGVGSLTAAVLIAWLGVPPARATRSSSGSM